MPNIYEVRVKGESDTFSEAVTRQGGTWRPMEDGLLEVSLLNGLGSDTLFRAAAESNTQIRHMTRRIPSLEEIFARAVGAD